MCSHVVKWGHWGVGGAAELVYTHPEFSFYGLPHVFSIFLEPKQYEKHFRNWFVRFIMFVLSSVRRENLWHEMLFHHSGAVLS